MPYISSNEALSAGDEQKLCPEATQSKIPTNLLSQTCLIFKSIQLMHFPPVRVVSSIRSFIAVLAISVGIVGCTQTSVSPRGPAPVSSTDPTKTRPATHPILTQGRIAPPTLQLSPRPRLYGPYDQSLFEYRDQTMTAGNANEAARYLDAFLKGGTRCINRVQRTLQNERSIELSIRQNDPFSATQFLLLCRGSCRGIVFRVETGFPSAYEVQDGSVAGYPLINIKPPRMAQNRDQGVVVVRTEGAAVGPAIISLLQLSRNPFAYGGGCN